MKISEKKKIKLAQLKKLTYAPCESNINAIVEKHFLLQNMHFDIVFC